MGKAPRFATARFLPLLLIGAAVPACHSFGDGAGDPLSGDTPNAPANAAGADAPKAPPVHGAPQTSDLVESLGVFVTPSGTTDGDGTRARPLASIQAGIDLAKKVGKRVYVCKGTFAESLTVADSISLVGGLDCSHVEWAPGAPGARTRIEARSSPAIVAREITTATRLYGFDVVAPDADAPSASSIGLFATRSPALVVASSSITAGAGAKGSDGVDGVQLVQTGHVDGNALLGSTPCDTQECELRNGIWSKPMAMPGGRSVCEGAPGHDGEVGGSGGSGGLSETYWDGVGVRFMWRHYRNDVAYAPEGGGSRTSAAGAAGIDGLNARRLGTIDATGYVPVSGTSGTDGQPGKGGSGGAGIMTSALAASYPEGTVFRGMGGASGGAGGCPGLAGSGGAGGGASFGILLVESPITIEDASIASKSGGAAGWGAFGSMATKGGERGYDPSEQAHPQTMARAGGRGGAAGVSGNGSAGPSFAVAHVGAPPVTTSSTKLSPGVGGAGVQARTRTDDLGNTKTIPATDDGASEAIHAF